MASSRTCWLIPLCWIAGALPTVCVLDASSFRTWLYLMTAALVPPLAMLGVWRDRPDQMIAEAARPWRS